MRRMLAVATVGVVLAVVATITLPRLWPWWTDVVLDSRDVQVPCGQRPSVTEARRVLGEQRELVRRIEAVDPSVHVMLDSSVCPGRGTLVIFYGAHRHRKQIEHLIGGDTLVGVPYSLRNI
jgi:hypothetical protein